MFEFFEYVELPLDEDDPRYRRSFSVDEARSDAARDFFDEYGLVIFRDVIDEVSCEETIDDMWSLLREAGTPGVRRDDPGTWDGRAWTPLGMPRMASTKALFRPSLLRLRQHPSVVECFAGVLGSDHVVCGHDRWVMHRPANAGGASRANVHLDMNPAEFVDPGRRAEVDRRLDGLHYGERRNRAFVSENNDVHSGLGRVVQGMLNLGDLPSDEDGGGTTVIPGSHRWFDSWARKECRSYAAKGPTQHRFEPECVALAQRATMRPGSLLVWDQRVVHGSTPNNSGRVRYCVPMRFLRTDQLRGERARDRAETVRRKVREEGFEDELTALGESVFYGNT